MDEGRKRVLLIAASILAPRKLVQFDGGKKVPATVSAIADAVRWAEEIMRANRRPLAGCELSLGQPVTQKFRSHLRDKPPRSAAEMPREARSHPR